jgi:hypothetical protein
MKKNRKLALIILVLIIFFVPFGCTKGSGNVKIEKSSNDVGEILKKDAENVSEVSSVEEDPLPGAKKEWPAESQTEVDVDLTKMTSNMVYAEVYNMLVNPEAYIGKTIRMEGLYTVFEDEETGEVYHGCIVQDATACCASGIEFRSAKELVYPDEYPWEGEEILVIGVFDTYLDGEDLYCTLTDAEFWR